jgi:hypothetical protein
MQLRAAHWLVVFIAQVCLVQAVAAQSVDEPSGQLVTRAALDVAAYADSDHVYVLTPSIAGSIEKPTAGWRVGGQYLVDAVSAASVDIVATASRRWHELRHAGSLEAAYKPGAFGVAANAAVSSEPDYLALSAGATATQDLFDQNLTLLFGFTHDHDVAGRSGTPFAVFARPLDRENVKLGGTLVLDPATLATFGIDTSYEHGDPSKPYRYIPLFEPGVSVPRGASTDTVNTLRVSARPLEQLPLARTRSALSGGILHRLDASTLRIVERLYADTWALFATTTDARWLFDWGEHLELGPHLRLHAQTGVNFWQRAYRVGPAFDVPSLRTGDRELGPLLAATLGLTLRLRLGPRGERDRWRLGLDVNVTETRYLNALYLERRLSAYTALSLEAQL